MGHISRQDSEAGSRSHQAKKGHSQMPQQLQSQHKILLKVVDVGARELGCDVPNRTPEDRIHEVLFLEEGALVVGALASVVEGKDARVFFAKQVCSLFLSA